VTTLTSLFPRSFYTRSSRTLGTSCTGEEEEEEEEEGGWTDDRSSLASSLYRSYSDATTPREGPASCERSDDEAHNDDLVAEVMSLVPELHQGVASDVMANATTLREDRNLSERSEDELDVEQVYYQPYL